MAGTITVFGGTGFIGRHLIASLLKRGARIRLAARHPDRVELAAEATNAPEIVQADILDDASVGDAIAGVQAVVNLVGILTETTTQTYRAIHVEAARRVALATHRHGVTRLIHLSALGASPTLRRSRTGQRLRENRPSERHSRSQQSSGRASCLGRMITS